MNSAKVVLHAVASVFLAVGAMAAGEQAQHPRPTPLPVDLPDSEIAEAYRRAAEQNVLAAVNPKVFPGYWSVCADGQGFGYGNTYPSLDGHQMTDALLFLGQEETVKANWDYVRSFQRPNGQLPLAILPASAGGKLPYDTPVDANGGLYRHWVPGDPLRALAGPTYLQNADVIFRRTGDRAWLAAQRASINLAADCLAGLTREDGAVGGAGYYIERPTRIEYDGVTQCHAADAFRRVADLNRVLGYDDDARRYQGLADRVTAHFQKAFWVRDQGHFAEYIHPTRGVIANHGLTDVDWSAIATGAATADETAAVWPKLKDEKRFRYGGMPTGIATLPETYEPWESTHPDRYDLAAMGRVWYLECWARARMGDAEGLADSLRVVARVGRDNGYYWRERYNADGPHGPNTYCEYPANLIRIVQRFLLGVEFRLDGAVQLAPVAPDEFWSRGFGQTISWRGRTLTYRMRRDDVTGDYVGDSPQRLFVKPYRPTDAKAVFQATLDARPAACQSEGDLVAVTLPPGTREKPTHFEIRAAR